MNGIRSAAFIDCGLSRVGRTRRVLGLINLLRVYLKTRHQFSRICHWTGGWHACYAACVLLLALAPVFVIRAAPFVPTDNSQVLERIPSTLLDPDGGMLRRLRSQLTAEPENFELAANLARRYLQKYRAESDPRCLGYAQSVLAPWWHLPEPSAELLVLRATIRQSLHDFENALRDLDLALKVDPQNAQAWLTRATILQVRGDYEEAKRSCIPLFRLSSELIAVGCAVQVASLTGEADNGYRLAKSALQKQSLAGPEERIWVLTLLAEIAANLGRADDARGHFQQALDVGRRDGYLLGAYADFLLDQGQSGQVHDLLQTEIRTDPLLLRLALAEKSMQPQPKDFSRHVVLLGDRFKANLLRGDNVHQREEARFTLHLLNQPQAALALAQANWNVQKEPADARILLEAALAVDDRSAAEPVVNWLTRHRTENVQLTKLIRRVRKR